VTSEHNCDDRRRRLPDRRPTVTTSIAVGDQEFAAAVGFYPDTLTPGELFLSGAKDGTDMGAILADTSILVSVALQCGLKAEALARSMSRLPEFDDLVGRDAVKPASVIGAALDLIAGYEREGIA
jgi:ribonucleoside-diphosphate reductase alpha chain